MLSEAREDKLKGRALPRNIEQAAGTSIWLSEVTIMSANNRNLDPTQKHIISQANAFICIPLSVQKHAGPYETNAEKGIEEAKKKRLEDLRVTTVSSSAV